MQIDIHAGFGVELTDKVRAYVEYRMFSAASRFEGNGARVSVRLDEERTPARARYRCVAMVGLGSDGRVLVSASADRLNAAVDRVAERLSGRVGRLLAGTGGSTNAGREGSRPAPTGPARATGRESES